MKNFLDKIDKYNDKPVIGRKVIDPSGLVSWNIVEEIVNTNKLFVELIEGGNKIDIPYQKYFWYGNYVQDKRFIVDKIRQGLCFVILQYSSYNKEINDLCRLIEEYFPVLCDAHIYGGLSKSQSFAPHVDIPPNFIIQVEGTTTWRLFKNIASDLLPQEEINSVIPELDLEFEETLEPGDVIYIPSRTFHQAIPSNKRLSISIPCRSKKYEPSYTNLDRNYYALT